MEFSDTGRNHDEYAAQGQYLPEVPVGNEGMDMGAGHEVTAGDVSTEGIGIDDGLVHGDEAEYATATEAYDDQAPAADAPAGLFESPDAPEADDTTAASDHAETDAASGEWEPPIVVPLAEPIESNGAADAHSEFDLVGTEETRERVVEAATELVRSVRPDIDLDDVVVSCFGEGFDPTSIESADEHKLGVPSSVPEGGFIDGMDRGDDFGGDDSNTHNLLQRDMQLLRNERGELGRSIIADDEMRASGRGGVLAPGEREEALRRTEEINGEIAGLKERLRTEPNLPVYYTTPFSGLSNEDGEDNPLGYAGDMPEPGDPPTKAYLAFYDRPGLEAAGIEITEKSDEQLRMAGHGRDIMPHCLGILEVSFVGTERADEPEEY
jgi:hypothetical protein